MRLLGRETCTPGSIVLPQGCELMGLIIISRSNFKFRCFNWSLSCLKEIYGTLDLKPAWRTSRVCKAETLRVCSEEGAKFCHWYFKLDLAESFWRVEPFVVSYLLQSEGHPTTWHSIPAATRSLRSHFWWLVYPRRTTSSTQVKYPV